MTLSGWPFSNRFPLYNLQNKIFRSESERAGGRANSSLLHWFASSERRSQEALVLVASRRMNATIRLISGAELLGSKRNTSPKSNVCYRTNFRLSMLNYIKFLSLFCWPQNERREEEMARLSGCQGSAVGADISIRDDRPLRPQFPRPL